MSNDIALFGNSIVSEELDEIALQLFEIKELREQTYLIMEFIDTNTDLKNIKKTILKSLLVSPLIPESYFDEDILHDMDSLNYILTAAENNVQGERISIESALAQYQLKVNALNEGKIKGDKILHNVIASIISSSVLIVGSTTKEENYLKKYDSPRKLRTHMMKHIMDAPTKNRDKIVELFSLLPDSIDQKTITKDLTAEISGKNLCECLEDAKRNLDIKMRIVIEYLSSGDYADRFRDFVRIIKPGFIKLHEMVDEYLFSIPVSDSFNLSVFKTETRLSIALFKSDENITSILTSDKYGVKRSVSRYGYSRPLEDGPEGKEFVGYFADRTKADNLELVNSFNTLASLTDDNLAMLALKEIHSSSQNIDDVTSISVFKYTKHLEDYF